MAFSSCADLSHWDFVHEFSAIDTAALILGTDPAQYKQNLRLIELDIDIDGGLEVEGRKISIVFNRMRADYMTTLGMLQFSLPRVQSVDKFKEVLEVSSCTLPSMAMHHVLFEPTVEAGAKLIQKGEYLNFEEQVFNRWTIAKWLDASGFKSAYQFRLQPVPSSATESRPSSDGWPWGSHHTELLGHLKAAAQRFWVNHDPEDSGTAPTNAVVSEWLRTTRGVSRTMADAIASILRADGLPTGPRR